MRGKGGGGLHLDLEAYEVGLHKRGFGSLCREGLQKRGSGSLSGGAT